jgi:hypothetical protein
MKKVAGLKNQLADVLAVGHGNSVGNHGKGGVSALQFAQKNFFVCSEVRTHSCLFEKNS